MTVVCAHPVPAGGWIIVRRDPDGSVAASLIWLGRRGAGSPSPDPRPLASTSQSGGDQPSTGWVRR